MEKSCAYSFADLYRAAFGKLPEPKVMLDLFSKPREEINLTVIDWAKAASWETKRKKGADGYEYLAFGPPGST